MDNIKNNNEKKAFNKPRSINLVLLAISLIIFGSLGLMIITQMELLQGWTWQEFSDDYPIDSRAIESGDINNDGVNEIAIYTESFYPNDHPDEYTNIDPNFGVIRMLDGKTGKKIWGKDYDGPVIELYNLPDYDGDGSNELFASVATVAPEWKEFSYIDGNGENITYMNKLTYPNRYRNFIINGSNGKTIHILTGDGFNVSNLKILDFISLNNIRDNQEDFICLQLYENQTNYGLSTLNITGYFRNGTVKNSRGFYLWQLNMDFDSRFSHIDLFDYKGKNQLLYFSKKSLILFNFSSQNYMDAIYNVSFSQEIRDYEIIKDLTYDGVKDIVLLKDNGYLSLIDGYNGSVISNFPIDYESSEGSYTALTELKNDKEDGYTYLILENNLIDSTKKKINIYSISKTDLEIVNIKTLTTEMHFPIMVLNEDLSGDGISEVIISQQILPFGSSQRINRYTVMDIINNNIYGVINAEFGGNNIIRISDFDGDSENDFLLFGWERVSILSSSKPEGIWLSPIFPLGVPFFIVLCCLIGFGIILILLNARKLKIDLKQVKKSRLAIIVNIIVLTIMTLNVIFFISILNVFNSTLILGYGQSTIVITYLIVITVWYGLLPLTAAVYNQFAPQFAYFFIRLRNLFFKVRKNYEHKILVIDMKSRQELTTRTRIVRVILPMLLSIAIAFYTYNNLAPFFGYPTGFDQFGGTKFFNFMIGYILFGIVPMIITFLVFSFFISGNFLLDDAGIVYYAKPLKARKPSDIEPISIWSQSIIKGIAGFSALITFGTFLLSIDLSGFFEGDLAMAIIGVLLTIVLFYGTPFLTAFSYILLAIEIMNFSHKENTEKLYRVMEDHGIDIKPYDISKIFTNNHKSK